MNGIRVNISLFGQFEISCADVSLNSIGSAKATELLGYLFLHRSRSHTREALATLLWQEGCTTRRARTYLRKALWQLQKGLEEHAQLSGSCLLRIDSDWVRLEIPSEVWFDLALFEDAYAAVKGTSGEMLEPEQIVRLDEAVNLYRGDLLENWYQRWCLDERSRIKRMYLRMLDKLLGYSRAYRWHDRGLEYGERILCLDRAREQTHRDLMYLRYETGDRTGALRQYERCVHALEEELNVGPSAKTQALYDEIRNGRRSSGTPLTNSTSSSAEAVDAAVDERLERIQHVRRMLGALHDQIQREIDAIDSLFEGES